MRWPSLHRMAGRTIAESVTVPIRSYRAGNTSTMGCDVRQKQGESGNPWHQTSALAHCIVSAPAHQGRCDRACQQVRKNDVGRDGQERALSGTCRARGVNEVALTSGVM